MAWLGVRVPEQANVYINDFQTKSKGTSRRYGWENLAPDQAVTCEVRAEIVREGRKVQETKKVKLRAGTVSSLAFNFTETETSLTLKVPADAKVYLGNSRLKELKQMKGTGAVRSFRTTKLVAGQKLTGYQIRVSVVRDGQLLSKQQTISLAAGDAQKLVFEFGDEAAVVAVQHASEQSSVATN